VNDERELRPRNNRIAFPPLRDIRLETDQAPLDSSVKPVLQAPSFPVRPRIRSF